MAEPSILLAASEALPFEKTGGLGDVLGALPLALTRLGVNVRVVIPLTRAASKVDIPRYKILSHVDIQVGNSKKRTSIYKSSVQDEYEVYLVRHDPSFDRSGLYGPSGSDWPDNAQRFALFAKAVVALLERLDEPVDLVHCHDWQTALIPLFLQGKLPTIFTIHNLGYQGLFPVEVLPETGIPAELFTPEGIEFWGRVNFLKAGIIWSDAITTVSPRYALEIKSPDHGFGLDGLLRKYAAKLQGSLTGADYEVWDPARDPVIAAPYGPADLSGKDACRRNLLATVGLVQETRRPVIGMITRLALQKGIDLLLAALPDIFDLGADLIILGSGDHEFEESLKAAAAAHPRLRIRIGFDEAMAHQITAGADFLLMPSRYEPCGLSQMYALKYGTVPVVRVTGGLADTVEPWDPASGAGTGFVFEEATPAALADAVRRALAVWAQPAAWRRIVGNGMSRDYSWSRSAARYRDLYHTVTAGWTQTGWEVES